MFSVDFRFLDAGPTTPSKTTNSHYDHVLVSESLRMPHHYHFPNRKGMPNGPQKSSDLEKPYGEHFFPNDKTAALRMYETKVRSYQLSDHLPVQVVWVRLNIGT